MLQAAASLCNKLHQSGWAKGWARPRPWKEDPDYCRRESPIIGHPIRFAYMQIRFCTPPPLSKSLRAPSVDSVHSALNLCSVAAGGILSEIKQIRWEGGGGGSSRCGEKWLTATDGKEGQRTNCGFERRGRDEGGGLPRPSHPPSTYVFLSVAAHSPNPELGGRTKDPRRVRAGWSGTACPPPASESEIG